MLATLGVPQAKCLRNDPHPFIQPIAMLASHAILYATRPLTLFYFALSAQSTYLFMYSVLNVSQVIDLLGMEPVRIYGVRKIPMPQPGKYWFGVREGMYVGNMGRFDSSGFSPERFGSRMREAGVERTHAARLI